MSIGVILDIDGTFVDTNEARAQAWVEALREHGYTDVSFREARELAGVCPHDFLLRTIGFGLETELGQKLRDRYNKNFEVRYLPRVMPFLRAPELLYRLRSIGARIVVASPDPQESLGKLLDSLNGRALLKHAITPDTVSGIRTNRDLVQAAAERLGAGTNVMIADAPHDIEAAQRHGIPVIAFKSGGFTELGHAAAVYEDAAALFSDFYRSPLVSQPRKTA